MTARRAAAALALLLLGVLFALGIRHDTAEVIPGTASAAATISAGACWVEAETYACAPAVSPDGHAAGRLEEDGSVAYPGSDWYFASDEGRFLPWGELQPAEAPARDVYTI